jgi:ankyrin repeat protein
MLRKYANYLFILAVAIVCTSCSGMIAHFGSSKTKSLVEMSVDEIFEDQKLADLAKAAGKGNIKKMEELIRQGVDVNGRGKYGATPLLIALQNKKGFEYLLKNGANPNLRLEKGSSVMHWAAGFRDCDFLRMAIKYGGDIELRAGMFYETPIFSTITLDPNDGISECLKVLIDAGADINAVSGNTNPLIVQAADLGRYDIVLFLIEQGADVRKKNAFGKDLLRMAKEHEGVFIKESSTEKDRKKVLSILKRIKEKE